ncbi:FAD-dependent oxidoreductase [Cognatishimia sp. SS12]|uniref:FAD-dependent monooxygenase n=1 Tax=Cognatishimia sp. SS12 TaxID=2979465 RepID=UPI00232D3938|nr:FAD-dependent monooxygenase [Cognatishimia sp. SS12]MDC0737354.1 FAD-dependent oxidoreductase [Cognatishimia sp. SS12]
MSLLGMHIAVIGGGIGGLTTALAFAHRGASVTVLEQAETISEVGAGLQISPNGLRVLDALGLGEDMRQLGVAAKAVELRDYRAGMTVARIDVGGDATGAHLFMHRADLIDRLAAACRGIGVKLRLLQKAKTVVPGPRPKVMLANGAELIADLVVAADGLHSVARGVLNGTSAPFFTGQCAWRATVPNRFDHPNVAQIHMGPKRHLVSYPLRGGRLVNLVAVQERSHWVEEGWALRDSPDNMRAAFADFGGAVPAMLAEVKATGLWGLFRHPVAPRWHQDNVVLLGDAAHPTLPFMAQGAVMAIEDAWVLVDSLSQVDDRAAGLALYQQRRFERVSKIVDTANGNAWKYHLSFPPLRWAAHTAMRTLSTVAPRRLTGQFDWIYQHDVTREAA